MSRGTDAPEGPPEVEDLNVRQAFARALGSVGRYVKDNGVEAGAMNYKFADINQILDLVKGPLDEVGLALSQPIIITDGILSVQTMLIHVGTGESLVFPGPGCPVKGDPQHTGSAITYFRRYALVSLFALEAEDDDGGVAHRAASDPMNRTPAETAVRSLIGALPRAEVEQFQHDFREQFGSTMTALPESRHGDALTFTKAWEYTEPVQAGVDVDAEA
jgi:hypothetical protein